MQNTYQGQIISGQIGRAGILQTPRLEVTQEGFPKSGQETGPLLNRPVCLQNEPPIAAILQLEARPHSTSSGCPINIVGKPLSLHVSPVCTDPSLLGQASQGWDIDTDYCTNVAQLNLVPTIVEQSGGYPNPLATNPRYCDQPHRSESSISNPGPSPTSRMASFRRSIHAEGLSERVMDLLQKSWRQSTESAYSSAWRQWDS